MPITQKFDTPYAINAVPCEPYNSSDKLKNKHWLHVPLWAEKTHTSWINYPLKTLGLSDTKLKTVVFIQSRRADILELHGLAAK